MKKIFDEIAGYELMCKECKNGCLKCKYQYICTAVTDDLKPSEWNKTDIRRFRFLINECIQIIDDNEKR